MQKALVEKLKKACPQVWSRLGGESTNLMFGVQVGDGWFGLLCDLSITIAIELNNFPENRFHFTEVKEKLGRLVIRHEGSENDSIYEMIDAFCDNACWVCELCGTGQHAHIRDLGDGVLKCLCINCVEPLERISHG